MPITALTSYDQKGELILKADDINVQSLKNETNKVLRVSLTATGTWCLYKERTSIPALAPFNAQTNWKGYSKLPKEIYDQYQWRLPGAPAGSLMVSVRSESGNTSLAAPDSIDVPPGRYVIFINNNAIPLFRTCQGQLTIKYACSPKDSVAPQAVVPSLDKEPSAKPAVVNPSKDPATTRTGKLLVLHDEWILCDYGFQQAPNTEIFVKNIAKFFDNGKGGRFLDHSAVFTRHPDVRGTTLSKLLSTPPYTFIRDRATPLTLKTLLTYDGVFVGRESTDNKLLIEYIKQGGNVCLVAGAIGDESEALMWNPLLEAFGLRCDNFSNYIKGVRPVNNQSHPLFVGVKSLYQDNGMTVHLMPNSKASIIMKDDSKGLIGFAEHPVAAPEAVASPNKEPSTSPVKVDPSKAPATIRTGKLLVLDDEYILSDHGHQQAPDTEIFVKNIAKYLTSGKGGKFLDYSTYSTTNQTAQGTAMEKALASPPYAFKRDRSVPLDLNTLRSYEVVIVGGEPVDNQILIDYIKSGGSVCLIGGTGHGGSESEAASWNKLLTAFGLRLETSYNLIAGVLPVTSPGHPLFEGVKALFQYWGQTVELLPDSKASIIMTCDSKGLIGLAEVPVTP